MHYDGMQGSAAWMWLFWVTLLLIVALALWSGRHWRRDRTGAAEEILKQRYARGEINQEQYERMLATLRRP